MRAALQPLADNLGDLAPIELVAGGRGYDLPRIARELVDLAYRPRRHGVAPRRVRLRGGILDVFPPTADHPLRVEFFGDEVEELRAFSVADQRSLPDRVERMALAPSRELLLTEPVRQRARELVHEFPAFAACSRRWPRASRSRAWSRSLPGAARRLVPSSTYLPEGAAVALVAPSGSPRAR